MLKRLNKEGHKQGVLLHHHGHHRHHRRKLRKLTYPEVGAYLFPEALIPGTDINAMSTVVYIGTHRLL